MYPLFETFKIVDGVPQHLNYHQERMQQSYAKLYGGICPFSLKDIFATFYNYDKIGVVKARFFYNQTAYFIDAEKYSPKTISSLQLLVCNTIDYSLKYSNREIFTELLEEKGNSDEILIIKNGYITDTSFSNIAFSNGTTWYTPSTPLLAGTCRKRLLQNKCIQEKDITIDDLGEFKEFRLLNAMLEFEQQKPALVKDIQALYA